MYRIYNGILESLREKRDPREYPDLFADHGDIPFCISTLESAIADLRAFYDLQALASRNLDAADDKLYRVTEIIAALRIEPRIEPRTYFSHATEKKHEQRT